jgi:aldehyde:ferredoxin oxidoreductase
MEGYQNRVLRVDLGEETTRVEPLNMDWAKDYIGGKGLGIKYLYEELAPGTDPLSPQNKLILMTGPLTGTVVPCSGKLAIISRSPATGTILDCSIGGHFAAELKFAGYDAVILDGKAKDPSYLFIEDDRVELRDAAKLWGLGAHKAEELLTEEYGEDVKILTIGPAGENLLPMSCINSEYYRQAGRGGIGAVMGSKNLKAIVLKGTKGLKTANMKTILQRVQEMMRQDTLSDDNYWAFTDGTPMIVDLSQTTGILPTHNFQDGTFPGFQGINSDAMKAARKGKKACVSCGLGCGNYTRIGDDVVEGPEYETLALCGSNCGIDDLQAVVAFNKACDDMGLDTISVGNVTALAMELTEKGLHDFGLRFGETEIYLQVPEMMAKQEGIGRELALGSRELARRYGGEHFAMQVKGLEFPGYEPRGSWGMGLAYATSDRGACHMRAWPVASEAYGDMDPFTAEGKAQLVIDLQHYNSVKFSTILCDFWALSLDTLAEVLSLVTDAPFTTADLEKTGERVVNTARLFNGREGFTGKDDTLPGRIFKDPLKSGATEGKLLPESEFAKMLAEYYNLRGWQENGAPGEKKMRELGI